MVVASFNLYIISNNSSEIYAINIYKDNKNKKGYFKFDKDTNFSLDLFKILHLRDYVCNIKGIGDSNKNNLKLWKLTANEETIDNEIISTEIDIIQKLNGIEMKNRYLFRECFKNELNNKNKSGSSIITIIPTTTATTSTAVLSSQQSISPFQRDFDHGFYDREQAIDQIAKIANINYSNRLSTYHQNHFFIVVPGGSGIGKSRVGMESQHLIPYAEKSVLMNIDPNKIDLVKAAFNDPCYIFIDFSNGCKYFQKLDKMPASVRIGARIAVASGIAGTILENLQEESLNLYRFDDVMQEILHHRFKKTYRSLEAIIIHIDEYQMYIDDVQQVEKISWVDARKFFKEMLNVIGLFMSNQKMKMKDNKSKLEFFIIPICTGTSAIDIHFLHSEYIKVLVHLKPLSYSSALKMFFDKYTKIEDLEICKFISNQEHFQIALFDTGFVPKFLNYFLSPETITSQTDWGNNLHYRMMAQSVKVDPNNSGYWKSREDIRTIISFGLTRQIVMRNFLLPSKTSIGDVERDGLIFLANPENYPDDKFIIIIPFMLMKILNQMLLPHSFFPDDLLLIPTADHPWQWQDFERLHGYYQRALIEALINVKNARITDKDFKEINNLLANEEQKSWCLSDIFCGAKGDTNLLQCQVKLCQLGVFTEKNKLLVETTDIAELQIKVLCNDGIFHPLNTAIFHCADGCANINYRWVLESASNGKPLAIFMQDKHSDFDTDDSTVSGPELMRWYKQTLQSVSSYSNDYDIILVFFTVRRFTGSNLKQMPRLLLIDNECISKYLSSTFSHRGLVSPPNNY